VIAAAEAAAADGLLWKLLAGVALVLVNGFFVAAEFAVVKVRDTQLQPLVARGLRRARVAQHIARHIDAYIGATQLGITLAGLGMGALVEPLFGRLLLPVFDLLGVQSAQVRGAVSFACGFLMNSFVLIVVGELGPKAIALRRTVPVMLSVAWPLELFYRVTYPFIWLLNTASRAFLRLLGFGADALHEGHSEEELRLMIAASQERAGGTELGRDIVLNALDLRNRVAREVMRPRREICALDTAATLAEGLELADRTRFSRFPLCEDGDLDRTLGVVNIKDLYALRGRAGTGADLRPLCRELLYIPETARLERVLQRLLERRTHLALVVDEHGVTVGLLTLENILEELVGQIQDEFDQEQPRLVAVQEGVWELAGDLPLFELAELTGQPLAAEGISSVSGWITQQLGGFPRAGEAVTAGPWRVEVTALDGPRVARLRLTRLPEHAAE
jgi:CBS domain containing-hemolysin-like protein